MTGTRTLSGAQLDSTTAGRLLTPAIILVRPQMGENIGAAARAMLNFGLSDMHIVAPRDGWPNPRANATASGAGRVLDAARIHDTTAQAIADCHVVYATTARPRDLIKPVLTPEAAMAEARAHIAAGRRIGLMFGPERAGLENDDLAAAQAIVSVPVNPDFPSLNLAQCVLLMAYEWGRATTDQPPRDDPDPATRVEVEKLGDRWEDALQASGFFYPPEKADNMKLKLRNLWSRMPLARGEVQILHGILRQLTRKRPD